MDDIKITKDLKFGFEDLMLPVDFESEFTLRDVLRACMESLIPIEILCPMLQCSYIPKYWDEAQKPCDDEDERGMEYLELYWEASKSLYDGKREDGSSWSFHGMGKEGEIPDDLREHCSKEEIKKMEDSGYRQAYAIEFTPMNNLADYTIRVSDKLHITDWDIENVMDMDSKIDLTPTITLMELLYWIFWELSFAGSPEDRDEMMGGLKKTVDDFKSGKLETVPWEEAKARLEEKFAPDKNPAFDEIKESLEQALEHSKGNLDLKTTEVEVNKED